MPFDPEAVRVVLVSPRNPLNIGAAARAMSNFGFLRLRVVNPYDVAYHEAKSAVNAAAVLDASEQFPTVAAAIADCSLVVGTSAVGPRQLRHPLRRLETAAGEIRAHTAAGRVALLFGSEKFGLSNEEMSYCHWLLRIPTRSEHVSMNLGQAVAICLYELIRSEQAAAAEPLRARIASGEQRELFTRLLLELLNESGYINPVTAVSGEEKIRRMAGRLNLTEADVQMWLGIIRQVRWRVRQANHSPEEPSQPPSD